MNSRQACQIAADLVRGEDGNYRPAWAYLDAAMLEYFDTEWGRPTQDSAQLLEILSLELLQSGLSWQIILRKRATIRQAFADFDPATVAQFGTAELTALLENSGVIRHEKKLRAIINNAQCIQLLDATTPGFGAWLWQFAPEAHERPATVAATPSSTPAAHRLAKELKRQGFQWLGPTTCYAAMQALGMVNDRPIGCLELQDAT